MAIWIIANFLAVIWVIFKQAFLPIRDDVWDYLQNNGGGDIGAIGLAITWLLKLSNEVVGIH